MVVHPSSAINDSVVRNLMEGYNVETKLENENQAMWNLYYIISPITMQF